MRKHNGHGAQHVFRILLEQHFFHAPLMDGIGDRVHQADDERLGASIDQLADLLSKVILVKLHDNAAGRIDPFTYGSYHRNRHQRFRPICRRQIGLFHAVQALPVAAPAR